MKFNKLIVNASPIISLANIGYADLLKELSDQLIIPLGVYEEITYHKYSDKAKEWIEQQNKAIFHKTSVPEAISAWNLGKGESQVISISYKNNCSIPVVIDDKPARKCAEIYKIKVKGTLSIIINAKNEGLIPKAEPLFVDLHANGFRISKDLIYTALKLCGEPQ